MTALADSPRRRVLADTNAARRAAAAARTVDDAERALRDLPRHADPALRRLLRVRVDHPDASLDELGGLLGMTKDQYAGRLRRALNDRPGGPS